MDRIKANQAIKDFITAEVLPQVKDQESFVVKVDNWTKRFEAVRSIQGLSYGDDPDKFPKTEPWLYCYTPDTDVLTKRGWISVKDVTTSDLVYSMNPMNKEAYWMPVLETQISFHEKMISFKGKSIDIIVSPNHNMVLENRRGKIFFEEAQKLLNTQSIEKNIPLVSTFKHYKKISEIYGFKVENWMSFLGWYISEGYTHKNSGTIGICQSEKVNKVKCAEIRRLLSRMNLKYSYDGKQFMVWVSRTGDGNRAFPVEAREELKSLGLSNEKYIPEQYLDLEPRLLNILLESLIKGDGTRCARRNKGRRDIVAYYTTSKKLADNIQELVQKVGLRTRIHIVNQIGKGGLIRGRRLIGKHLLYHLTILEKPRTQIRKQEIKVIEYNNIAYCLTTPFHTLYVRRNGIAIWCGNSSDIGVPIEAITLRAIIARFVKTIFTKPICNVAPRGKSDRQTAKIVQEYNEYTLEDEMNYERNFYDIMMDVGLSGDGWGKLVEVNDEYEWDETYFTLINPINGEPVIDPETKTEDDDEWPEGYPVEVNEDFEPSADPVTGLTPEVKEVTVTKKIKKFFGTKIIPVDPRRLILPDGCDTYDVDEMPWIGHQFKKGWHWLNEKIDDERFDKDAIGRVKPTSQDGKISTTDKIEFVEVWALIDVENSDGKKKPREIIALYAVEEGELLGWDYNPYKGQRMLFHWQIMPMPHQARGISIPAFARGLRDLIDSLLNNMINRDTINSHPPFVYDEESGFDPEIHSFGPAEFWGVNDKARLGRLDMGDAQEFRSQWIIEFALGLLQKLFGVTDYTLGSESNIASNKTARGIMAIIGEGNFSFDTMIALLQMTNKKFFEANIKMHAKMMKEYGMENKVFYVTEEKENPYREIALNALSLNWNFIPRGTSVNANVYRRKEDAKESYAILAKNPYFSPMTPTTMNNLKELTQTLIDAFDLKTITLPDQKQIANEMLKLKADAMQEIIKRQQLDQLKKVAKLKKGTPEGNAAAKVLADMELSGQGGAPEGGQSEGGQSEGGIPNA